ncbi:MAG TPA: hypothetical protein QF417_00335 [Acidimicrobiales bacterium]|nr:hypothetical protein [Actinomycetes bacterium]MDP6105886.1 hypothetical protein [Acidimicrobiales bacterium]MCP4844841.1 hypothetical protein [Actinomycetes bacterium]MDP6241565.1 hypothetical protein [Acidimicrobiales bacterium]MDP7123962.1 hypothetical protein [Acidimicrobiales bacterium]
MTMRVRAFVPDLMDRSRLSAPEVSVEFVPDPATLLDGEADLFVVDLARPGALEAVCSGSADLGRVVGFAPHVDVAVIGGARSAGLAEVLPRSAFFRRFPEVGSGG